MKKLLLTIVFFSTITLCNAQVKLPQLIRDSMILQRDQVIKLWGWASVNEKITVQLNGKTYKTITRANKKWSIQLRPTKAGGPYTIQINGKNKIVLKDILFGDVWLCSGQSNMQHQLNIHDVTYAKTIAEANDFQIRQFLVPITTDLRSTQDNLSSGYWQPAAGAAVRGFSAVAYFFAKKIHDQYNVPVGIINASVGGTPIEAWTSEDGLKNFPALVSTIEKNKDTGYVKTMQRNDALAVSKQINPADAGMTAAPKWFDINYTPKNWRTINVPGFWEDQGLKDLNGIVWYRKEIDLPASMINKPATVFLGRIVDADDLYINGQLVGKTTYQYPQRRYKIGSSILKAGRNTFVIRVSNTNGKGGFVTDKPYCIFSGNDTVDLKGYWQYKVGAVFKPTEPIIENMMAQNQPASLFNAMIAPAINYSIKGICWYQGETNTHHPEAYAQLLPALIHDWRNKWQSDSLPFLFVQLPNFGEYNYLPSESNWAVLREGQLKSLSVPNTDMAVAIDLGEWNDIHPDNKKAVGDRLAIAAAHVAYKENNVYSGPIFKSFTIEKNKIIINFSNTGTGLVTNDGEAVSSVEIAGLDKKFIAATASIDGDTLIVWSDDITVPKYVRYGWADNPVNPNLFNKEGLPASPFRTD